jgi:hypothetical protein
MKLIKLTALPLFFFISLLILASCEPDAELKKTVDYQKLDIPMTGAQETPPVSSAALGSMDVHYSKATKFLTYTVRWSGLTGPVSAMHIHGQATVGYPAAVVQNIITSSGGITTPSATRFPATGTFSANLLVDGVVVKENDILNGFYYINIHTAAFPAGEIRGQIKFQ